MTPPSAGGRKGLSRSQEEEEERANLTQLAWLAIIAPLLSVLERPSRCTIWTQLLAVYWWPLCPRPPLKTPPFPCCLNGGWDVPRLIKRGCGPLKNTVSIYLWLLLPLINMQCSMKEHCHPRDVIFIVSACVCMCMCGWGRGVAEDKGEGGAIEIKRNILTTRKRKRKRSGAQRWR